MKKEQIFDAPQYLEAAIVTSIGSFYTEFRQGKAKSEYRPTLASGVIQGMVILLEHSVIISGKSLDDYWSTERGKRLKKFIEGFYIFCRRQLLFQPLSNARRN